MILKVVSDLLRKGKRIAMANKAKAERPRRPKTSQSMALLHCRRILTDWVHFWLQPESDRPISGLPRAEPLFLAGVLDHLADDESAMLAFAEEYRHDPPDHACPRRRSCCRDARLGTRHAMIAGFCRDCHAERPVAPALQAPAVRPGSAQHAEIGTLSVAHVDCDAFYATIEKRDDPSLADKPLIVGGGYSRRGVDRLLHRAHSRRAFGDADVQGAAALPATRPSSGRIWRNMPRWRARCVRCMRDLTPLVEPVSIDEAFLDLSGTAAAAWPQRRANRWRTSRTRSSARSASPCRSVCPTTSSSPRSRPTSTSRAALRCSDAPRLRAFWPRKPISIIFGVGKVAQERLARDGFRTIADLQKCDETELMRRLGAEGQRLSRLARGIDHRKVVPDRDAKSVSAETTFDTDIAETARCWSRSCGT